MTRSSTSSRKSKLAASATRPRRRRTRALVSHDEPSFEKFFDYGEGHTARILTPNEVVEIADGRYVPPTAPKGSKAASAARPRRHGTHPPVASEELPPDPNYRITYEDRFGRPLTMEDVIDFIEGRREPP